MRLRLLLLLMLSAACAAPQPPVGLPCSLDRACPDGQVCETGGDVCLPLVCGQSYPGAVLDDEPEHYYRLGEPAEASELHDSATPGSTSPILDGPNARYELGVPGALAEDANTAVRLTATTKGVDTDHSDIDANVPAPAIDWSEDFSVEALIKPIALNETADNENEPGLFTVGTSTAPSSGFRVTFERDASGEGVLYFSCRYNGCTSPDMKDDEPVVLGEWMHVAVTYAADLGEVCLYKNGRLVKCQVLESYTPAVAPQDVLAFGPHQALRLDGVFDECALYTHVLTPERVLLHYRLAVKTGCQP